LIFRRRKYQFQATWFKSPTGTEKETKEFDSSVIVIDGRQAMILVLMTLFYGFARQKNLESFDVLSEVDHVK
jgi:hypothetical protein